MNNELIADALIESIRFWENEARFQTCRTGDGDWDNVFDGEPDYVSKAREALSILGFDADAEIAKRDAADRAKRAASGRPGLWA